jgi:hypothetical protein
MVSLHNILRVVELPAVMTNTSLPVREELSSTHGVAFARAVELASTRQKLCFSVFCDGARVTALVPFATPLQLAALQQTRET